MRTFRAETRKAASIQSKTLPSALADAFNVIRVAQMRQQNLSCTAPNYFFCPKGRGRAAERLGSERQALPRPVLSYAFPLRWKAPMGIRGF